MALVKGLRQDGKGGGGGPEEEGCLAGGNAAAPWGSSSDKLAKSVDCPTWKWKASTTITTTAWQAVKCSQVRSVDFRARTSRQSCYFWFCCFCSLRICWLLLFFRFFHTAWYMGIPHSEASLGGWLWFHLK